ncbi:MAG: DUF2585 family protein [Verrucomicrobiales bacterium]|nr:DUF2585 family protein [Verrucomicrobiales bacterium]
MPPKVTRLLLYALLLVVTTFVLRFEGRDWWCACGQIRFWDGDIWSSHCSQHLLDPYTFTHVLHGVALFLIGLWLVPKMTFLWRLWWATFLECLWEILENSPWVIERYRAVTVSLGYEGDTVVNAMGDILACVAGFALANWLGLRRSVILFVVIELILLVTIRDNLTLNVLMLVCPIEAIKEWQIAL